jgi:hypothetical protein
VFSYVEHGLAALFCQNADDILSSSEREVSDVNARHEEILIQKLKRLPPQRVAEVEDFIDFLDARERSNDLVTGAARVSEAAFKAVWDNVEDSEYDRL